MCMCRLALLFVSVVRFFVVGGRGCGISELLFFFKQRRAYEVRISDWSSDVCSSDLLRSSLPQPPAFRFRTYCGGLPTIRCRNIGRQTSMRSASSTAEAMRFNG